MINHCMVVMIEQHASERENVSFVIDLRTSSGHPPKVDEYGARPSSLIPKAIPVSRKLKYT